MSRRTYTEGTRPKTLYIIRYGKNHIEVDEPIRMEQGRRPYIGSPDKYRGDMLLR